MLCERRYRNVLPHGGNAPRVLDRAIGALFDEVLYNLRVSRCSRRMERSAIRVVGLVDVDRARLDQVLHHVQISDVSEVAQFYDIWDVRKARSAV